MYTRICLGLVVLVLAARPTEAQKIAATLTGVPVRAGVQPSVRTPAMNQSLTLIVTLLDGQARPANATRDVDLEITIRPPSGAVVKFSKKIPAGKSSDTQAYTPRFAGRYVVDVVDKSGRLLADSSSFFVFGKRAARWWGEADPGRWLMAKPPPPPPPRPAPAKAKATLHVGYYGGRDGVSADGNDAVEISVIYDDEAGGAAPEDISVWFRYSAGAIDKRPLVIPKGERLGEAKWTSKEAVQAATIDFVAPTQKYQIDLPPANTFKFVRQVVGMKPIVSPIISIVDRPDITVHFVDVNGYVVKADRKRSVTFSVSQSGVTVAPATFAIEEGGGPVRATITPASFGTAKIQIDSENLINGSTAVEIQVGLGSLIFLSFFGALAGGGLAYVRDRKALPLKLLGGVAGGFVLAAIYVFGVVPLAGAAMPLNAISAFVMSLIGGVMGIAVIDWAWGKLSKG